MTRVAVLVFVAALGFAVWWFGFRVVHDDNDSAVGVIAKSAQRGLESARRNGKPTAERANGQTAAPGPEATGGSASIAFSEGSLASPPAAAVVNPAVYKALGGVDVSVEEARWLNSKGFPLEREFHDAIKSSGEELRRRARSGDLVARAILGGRLARDPLTREAGLQLLNETSADGSIFSLHELSDVYRQSDPTRAVAYFRIALALGDTSAIPIIHHASLGFTPEQRGIADYEFVWRLAELNRLSVVRRGVPLSIELRPSGSGP